MIMAVTKDANGKWQSQVWFVDWQGNRKRKHKRGFDSKRAALQWERQFLGEAHGEIVTMDVLIKAFIKDIDTKVSLGNLKESTAYGKKNFIRRYIEPYFSSVEVGKVTTRHINEWLTTLNKTNKRAERMSSGTLNITRNMLSQIFDFAVKHYGLSSNPVKGSECAKPYTNDKRAKIWSLDEFHIFYRSLTDTRHKVIFNTLFFAGLRIGELLVLTPADIGDDVIDITKGNMIIGPSQTKVGTPKNTPSIRKVAIPHKLCEQLQAYISGLDGITPTDKIFDISEGTIRSFLTYRAKALGLPHISPHTLRHSFASHTLAITKDVAAVSYQLGHKSPETTLSVYSHMVPGANAEQAKILDDLVEI